jgi:hypothetical protein
MLLAASCEKVIKVNLPALKPQLVISSISEVGGPIMVSVSRSASLAERSGNPDLFVTNAAISLYTNGIFTETLIYDSLFGYISKTYTEPGKQYKIKVTAPTYQDAEAIADAPSMISIGNVTLIPNARKTSDGNDQDEVILTFTDPPAANDYYIVKLTPQHDSLGLSGLSFCINSADASIETISNDVVTSNTCLDNQAIFLRDALFNGRQKELKLYAESYGLGPQFNGVDTQYASIELWHVPEAYFRYLKSYKLARDVNGDPFSEPVNVYTNFTGGLGVFSIVSRDGRLVK